MSEFGIVVVSYNTRDLLDACLVSLRRFAPHGAVIVVDNASSDDSAALVRDGHPQVQLMALPDNLGFAAAANRGIAASQGEFVLLLNADTVLLGEGIMPLIECLRGDAGLAAAGPALVYPDGHAQESRTPFPRFGLRVVGRKAGGGGAADFPADETRVPPGAPDPRWYLMGAALLLRRRALEQVGPLDESYFFYLEEVDWFRRAHAAGWGWALVPEVRIAHHLGASVERADVDLFARITRNWHRSRLRYARRHHGAAAATMLRITSLPRFTVRWLAHELLGRFSPGSRHQVRARMWRSLAGDFLGSREERP